MTTKTHKDPLPDDGETLGVIKMEIDLQGYAALRKLSISVERGVVSIRGDCPSYYLYQVAIECAKRVPGVIRVHSHVKVAYDSIPQNKPPQDYEEEEIAQEEREPEVTPHTGPRDDAYKSEDDLTVENRATFAASVELIECYIGAISHD
jgi:hypothetical protein